MTYWNLMRFDEKLIKISGEEGSTWGKDEHNILSLLQKFLI